MMAVFFSLVGKDSLLKFKKSMAAFYIFGILLNKCVTISSNIFAFYAVN